MRYYRQLGNFGLIKTNIAEKKIRGLYIPDSDIKKEVNRGNFSIAWLLIACTIESYLRFLYLMAKVKHKKTILVKELERFNRVKFLDVIKSCKKKKLFNKKDARLINFIRDARNDIAHNHLLLYNQNLSGKVCKKVVLEDGLPLLSRLHNRALEKQDERKRFLKKINQ